ncbi:hypothetical protein [Georgenia sp. Z1491]
MLVTAELSTAAETAVCTLPVHVGTNGQVSSWGAALAGIPPTG